MTIAFLTDRVGAGVERAVSPHDGLPVTQTDANGNPGPTTSDWNLIYDHANGQKTAVTTSATILTPPTGCKYAEINTDADIVINTTGATAAVDNGTGHRIIAGIPEIIPVTAAATVTALSLSGTANVRITPFKVRP